MSAVDVDIDLEIARWVLDYLREKGSVLEADLVRGFFSDDPDNASSYLDFLKNGRAIYRSHRLGKGYCWFPVSDHKPIPVPASAPVKAATAPRVTNVTVTAAAPKRITHRDCRHPNTPWEKEQCRRARDENRNPADFRERQRRSRWGQFMDGEVHELTAEEIQELTGDNITPHQFERRVRAHASNYGLKCSAKSTEDGIQFIIGDSSDLDSGVSDYLPRDVVERDGGPLGLGAHTSHGGCTHPATRYERDKCRRRRKDRAAKAAA